MCPQYVQHVLLLRPLIVVHSCYIVLRLEKCCYSVYGLQWKGGCTIEACKFEIWPCIICHSFLRNEKLPTLLSTGCFQEAGSKVNLKSWKLWLGPRGRWLIIVLFRVYVSIKCLYLAGTCSENIQYYIIKLVKIAIRYSKSGKRPKTTAVDALYNHACSPENANYGM